MVWPFPEGHTCRTCRRVFSTVMRCQEHERVDHPPTMCCSVCGLKEIYSVTELLAHLKTHMPLICCHPRCGVFIDNIPDLIKHRAIDRLKTAPQGYDKDSAMRASSAGTMAKTSSKVPGSPMVQQKFFAQSPVSTPKRKFAETDASSAVTSGFQRTPTLNSTNSFKPRASTLTPAFNQLRLASRITTPINTTLFQSCLEDEDIDDEMMLSAIDTSTPQ